MTIEIDPRTSSHDPGGTGRGTRRADLGQFGGGVELLTVELGRRLGLYDDAARRPVPVTADELADRASIAPRYAVEWLDQQAAAGIVDVVGTDRAHGRAPRSCCRPPHAAVLIDPSSPAYLLGAAPLLLGVARTAARGGRRLRHRTRRRVRRLRRRAALRHRRAEPPGLHQRRCATGSRQLPDITAAPRPRRGHPRRRLRRGLVDDRAGRAFPDGHRGRRRPRRAVGRGGPPPRRRRRAGRPGDASCAPTRPTRTALRAATGGAGHAGDGLPGAARHGPTRSTRWPPAARLLAEGGAVLVGDEHGEDAKAAPADEIERLKLAMSVLHCVPGDWAESDEVVNGTVLRAAHVRRRGSREAGFAVVRGAGHRAPVLALPPTRLSIGDRGRGAARAAPRPSASYTQGHVRDGPGGPPRGVRRSVGGLVDGGLGAGRW